MPFLSVSIYLANYSIYCKDICYFWFSNATFNSRAVMNPSISKSIYLNSCASCYIYFPVNWDAILLTANFLSWQYFENFFNLSKFNFKLFLLMAVVIQGCWRIWFSVYLLSSGWRILLIKSFSYELTFFISGMSNV